MTEQEVYRVLIVSSIAPVGGVAALNQMVVEFRSRKEVIMALDNINSGRCADGVANVNAIPLNFEVGK
jgi:hypothetical protein